MRSSLALFVSILSLAACGDDGGHALADAPPGGKDGPDVDAAPQPVTLTVTQDGAPVQGIVVYFTNADSSPVASAMTDASGVAKHLMAAGGFVTALNPFPANQNPNGVASEDLRTFAGVQPGDQLVLTQDYSSAPVTFTVTGPISSGASYYNFMTSCGTGQLLPGGSGSGSGSGDATPAGSVTLYNCPATVDVLVEAYDFNNNLAASFYHPALAISEGAAIDLSADTFTATTDSTYSYTNVDGSFIQTEYQLASAHGRLDYFYGNSTVTAGAAAVTLHAPGFAGLVGITDSSYDTTYTAHGVVDIGPTTNAYALDFTGLALPDYSDRPQYDVPTHSITWTPGPGGVAGDFALSRLQVYRSGNISRAWNWTISAPYTAGKIVYPTLPTDVADYNATVDDSAQTYDLITAKVPGGYAAVRENIQSANGYASLITTGAGRIQYASLFIGKQESFLRRLAPHKR